MRQFRRILLLPMVLVCIPLFGTSTKTFKESAAFIFYQTQEQDGQPKKTAKVSKDPFINQLNAKINRHNKYNLIEKVFLHADKNMFSAGETIWYSAYVVEGPYHKPSNASKVIHIDLIGPDGRIEVSQTHELVEGKGSGSLEIPKNLTEGNYQLRSYTQWMRNFDADFFFTKQLSILNRLKRPEVSLAIEDKIDLQFFPEGGHMIASIAGKVSFKAIGEDGLPRKVTGHILDSAGRIVSILKTLDRGSGFFQLTPIKGGQYVAELNDGTQYKLPKVLNDGYTITVNNLNAKSIKLFVRASQTLLDLPFYLVGHMRQRNYFHDKFEFNRNGIVTFEIPKSKIPGGILTLTIFDIYNKPWCERAIFVNKKEELVINSKVNSNSLAKRGKITLDINVTDSNGKPISTNLSTAVTDAGQVKKNLGSGTILTHLLLESDIKGTVTEPGFLFKDLKRKTIQQLDLVMLTHGWRKYQWPKVWDDVKPDKEFHFAEGLTISGKAFKSDDEHMPNATLNVMAKAGKKLGTFSAMTDLDGRFSIPDFNFNGETKVVFNAHDYEDKSLDVKVSLDPSRTKVPSSQFRNPQLKQTEKIVSYETHSVARSRMEALYESNRVIKLDEVVVSEEKKEKIPVQRPSALGHEPDATLYTKDHIAIQTVLQLVQWFNGVTVSGNNVSIRNGGAPLWILDGRPLPNEATSSGFANVATGGPAPGGIATMDTFAVERVEILKGPRAAIWGARGANGVILVYTKRGEGQTYDPVLSPDFTISGHTAQKEFYSPKYDVKKEEHQAPDYRATLYWNPDIVTDENGNAKIEFFNSDTAKEIQVSIEGLSDFGIAGSHLESFGVQNQPIR